MNLRPGWRLCAAGLLPVLLGAANAQAQAPAATPTPTSAPSVEPSACSVPPEGGQRLAAGAVQAWWRTDPSPLRVGQHFSVLVTLCPAQAQLLRVDAHMPEHRHGMNYRPTLQALDAGRWRAEGLLWHMPGRWELLLETTLGEEKHRLVQTVVLR